MGWRWIHLVGYRKAHFSWEIHFLNYKALLQLLVEREQLVAVQMLSIQNIREYCHVSILDVKTKSENKVSKGGDKTLKHTQK